MPSNAAGSTPPVRSRSDDRLARLLDRALGGDRQALGQLATAIEPVVRHRVRRSVQRAPGSHGQASCEDLAQDVFVSLLANDARAMRRYRPERGLSVRNFVGLAAERRTWSLLRRHQPVGSDDTLDRLVASRPSPEAEAGSRDAWRRFLKQAHQQLTPRGRVLFRLLFLEQRTVPEIQRHLDLSAAAVYAWRSRLRKLARRLLADPPATTPRSRVPPGASPRR